MLLAANQKAATAPLPCRRIARPVFMRSSASPPPCRISARSSGVVKIVGGCRRKSLRGRF